MGLKSASLKALAGINIESNYCFLCSCSKSNFIDEINFSKSKNALPVDNNVILNDKVVSNLERSRQLVVMGSFGTNQGRQDSCFLASNLEWLIGRFKRDRRMPPYAASRLGAAYFGLLDVADSCASEFVQHILRAQHSEIK